jgi:hypothetical protein
MSAFRSLPATEIPATPPPDIVAQRKMIARTVDYAVKTVSSLPNFFATRETIRFENSPKGHLGRASLVPKNDVAEMSYEILAIDRILAKFGPDANELRSEFRQTVEFGLDRTYAKPFAISADGMHTVQHNSVDQAGNAETSKLTTIRIDQTPPTISGSVAILPR